MTSQKIFPTRTITLLASGLVLLSGLSKLIRLSQVLDTLRAMGVAPYVFELGIMEISFTLLYLYPKTMKLGFLLLTGYFAGALATELSHHAAPVALLPLALIWTSAFLRDRSIFLASPQPQ